MPEGTCSGGSVVVVGRVLGNAFLHATGPERMQAPMSRRLHRTRLFPAAAHRWIAGLHTCLQRAACRVGAVARMIIHVTSEAAGNLWIPGTGRLSAEPTIVVKLSG